MATRRDEPSYCTGDSERPLMVWLMMKFPFTVCFGLAGRPSNWP
jgi:hypothetical protein